MGWREQLREASFRGVPFLYEEAALEAGRRIVRHEYPLRDDPYHEDLGRAARVFRVTAFVLGDDYMAARDRLIEAVDAQGQGTLVHPYYGTIEVVCLRARVRESTRQGGMATFELEFERAGENRFPSATVDTRARVRSAAVVARTATLDDFAGRFDVKGPGFLADEARKIVTQVGNTIDGLRWRGFAPVDESATLAREIGDLKAQAGVLVNTPDDLGARIGSVIEQLGSIVTDPVHSSRLVRQTGGSLATLAPVPATTATRQRQADNQDALAALVRRSALVEEAEASTDIPFETYDDAVAFRDDLAERLDDELLAVGGEGDNPLADETFRALEDVRSAMIADITTRAADLRRLVTVERRATLPALVLSHQLYGDDTAAVVEQADVIVRRNRVRHPGFVPGGRPLQVFSEP